MEKHRQKGAERLIEKMEEINPLVRLIKNIEAFVTALQEYEE
jgi:hypothetical protein